MRAEDFRIGVYVLAKNAKQTYATESYDVRINAGMAVVCDILERAGYTNIAFCSAATVQDFDAILFSVTSDCDWWPFVAERIQWKPGRYKVLVGGQGVLNVRPFLRWVDYFQLGRCESYLVDLMDAIRLGSDFRHESVVDSATFSLDCVYRIAQVDGIYPHKVRLANGGEYGEDVIGCNHKCLFCGYTWHRKHVTGEAFNYSGLWNGGVDRERAIIDLDNGVEVDMNKLRTTAIDGLSERIRFAVNKRITRRMLRTFIRRAADCEHPHQVKVYNIIGYPTEGDSDWFEFLEDICATDSEYGAKRDKQLCLMLHSTPFRAMPATPLACEPMSYRNYRGEVARVLGAGKYRGNIFYQGKAIWAVEGMGTESLPTVIQSAVVWRGVESDAQSFALIARNLTRFHGAPSLVRRKTLEKYFDVERLFSRLTPSELPTRNILTYCAVEKMWNQPSRFKG